MYNDIISEQRNYKVYKHTTPNNKVYIGITSNNPKTRWSYGSGYIANKHFNNAIKKYGWNNIKHEILFENLSKKEAGDKEVELISIYNSRNPKYGFNITIGGECGSIGYTYTKDLKDKMKIIARDKLGIPVIKIVKITRYFNNFPGGIEYKDYNIETEYTRKGKRYAATIEYNEIFNSISEASEKTGFTKSSIYNSCKQKRHRYKDIYWMYYEDYIENKKKDKLYTDFCVKNRLDYESNLARLEYKYSNI